MQESYPLNKAAVSRIPELFVVGSGRVIENKAGGGMTAYHKSGRVEYSTLEH